MEALPFTPASRDGIFPFDFTFDANAVRALASLERRGWRRLERQWANLDLRAAWTPNTLAEVMGTNLRRRRLMHRDLKQLQLAVERYDQLAERAVLPPDDYMVAASIFVVAGQKPPAPRDPDPGWPEVVDAFLRLRSPSQVEFPDVDGKVVARLRGERGSRGVDIIVPRRFTEFVERKVNALRARRGYSGPVSRETMVEHLMADLPWWMGAVSRRVGVPDPVAKAALQNPTELFGSPFAARLITENIYYHHRATGYMSKVKENDAQDIALSTYMPEVWGLVTDDSGLRRLLLEVFEKERRVLRFGDLIELLESSGTASGH